MLTPGQIETIDRTAAFLQHLGPALDSLGMSGLADDATSVAEELRALLREREPSGAAQETTDAQPD